MRAVSDRFKNAVSGSHKMVARARIVDPVTGTSNVGGTAPGLGFQFGLTPTGTEIPILGGDVKLSSSAQIKATLDMETSGEYWDFIQPYGTEIFVERGIDYGDGTREWVGLGYFQVEEIHQDEAPNGPIRISASDRTRQLIQNRLVYPYKFEAPTKTLKYAFDRLVNGDPNNTGFPSQDQQGYGMFIFTLVPIHWETSGIDPNNYHVTGTVVEDSTFDYLNDRLNEVGNLTMKFGADGELYIVRTDVELNTPVYSIKRSENLVRASRGVSRKDVYNIVTTYCSDPAYTAGYQLTYNSDTQSRIRWIGRFGPAVRYYSSPLLNTTAALESAGETILSRYKGLPYSLGLFTVPNPALEPLDVIEVVTSPGVTERHIVDEVTIPLTADGGVEIQTRTINEVSND